MRRKPTVRLSPNRHQPQPAQVAAIRRLLDANDHESAIRKLEALVRQFPEHGGLRQLLVEALDRGRGPRAAALVAFDWAESRPNSLPAQEALFHFAVTLDHLALADRVATQLRAIGGDPQGFPLPPALKATLLEQPDGTSATAEDMVRFDIGKLHFEGQDFASALRWLEGVDVPPARNNYALALFHLGRVDEALAAFLAGWQRDAANLFALSWAVRLRLYQGDDTGSLGLTTPLAAATARRLDDAYPQLDALLLLQQDHAAWEAFQRSVHTEWFDWNRGLGSALLHHFGACAASRLGKVAEAERLWRAALEKEADFGPAVENLEHLEDDPASAAFPAVVELHQAFPLTWKQSLLAARTEPSTALAALSASNRYLEALYRSGVKTLRGLVAFVLRYRAKHSDTQAAECLKGLVRLPIGTREERFEILKFLQQEEILGRKESVDYWDGKQLRQVRVLNTEITRDPKPSDLPEDLDRLLSESIELFNQNEMDEAEGKLKAILEQVPDHPVVLGNLSAIYSSTGRPAEAVALLRQVVAQHPDYLFARCNLAVTRILDGDLEEATALLDGLTEREQLHIQDAFVLYGAMAMLAKAKGEPESALALIKSLETMAEDEDGKRRLAHAKRLLTRLDPPGDFVGLLKSLVRSRPISGRRKR